MTTFTRETASSSIRACTEPSRYWFPRLHCYRASIQPTCHDGGDVHDRRGEDGERVGSKGLGRSGHRKRGHVERESTERYWSLVSRRGEIYRKSYQRCPSPKNGPVTSGRAEGHLFERNFCSWSSWPIWFVCDVNFFIIFPFSFFFLDRDLWRLLTFFRWNIFKKYLSLDFLIDNR